MRIVCKTLLAHIAETIEQELLLCYEYRVTENCVSCKQLKWHVRLHGGEHNALAEIGCKSGKQTLQEMANIAKSHTILGWHRKEEALL